MSPKPYTSLPLSVALLRSGALPNDSEASMIREDIAGIKSELNHIVDEILCLLSPTIPKSAENQLRLLHLRSARHGLEQALLIPTGVFSPIRRLPYDVLSLIFNYCAYSDPWPTPCHSNDASSRVPGDILLPRAVNLASPWVLSRVCTRWRHVALTSPSLWSTLRISLRTYDEERSTELTRHTRLIELYLERSGTYPLRFDVSVANAAILAPHPILDILASHSAHWGDASLHLSPDLYESIASRVRGNVPRLESLKLRIQGRERGMRIDMFRDCPSLRSVDLAYPLRTFVLPWDQIEAVKAPLQTTEDLTQLFRSVRRAERLSISPTSSPRPETPVKPANRFPALREINLGSNLQYLEIISAPLLDSVSVLRFSVSEASSVHPYVTRSSYVANVLTAAVLDFTVLQLLNILLSVPELEHLEIRDSRLLTDEFFDALAFRTTSPTILPKLRSIVVVDDQRPVRRTLLRFLDSRNPCSPEITPDRRSIAFVYLEMAHTEEDGLAESVTKLRLQGVKVSGRCTRSFPI
ncbi:hypothetical protein HGRIS_003042 [Hohenbuehelia grisea]|uniref:F-box domain-containing protein n=1 Tax=Hohenbuehelia grisea TaxID=104357 RepID=A0ABR3JNA0_9AGAR